MRRPRTTAASLVTIVAVCCSGGLAIPVSARTLPTLTRADARDYSVTALRRYFQGDFYLGGFNANCSDRISRVRVRCGVAWYNGDFGFHGRTVIWYSLQPDGVHWNYAFDITRLDTYCLQVQRRPASHCIKRYHVS